VGLPSTALGFRIKSGWATAILLSGPVDAPELLERRVVQLSDEAVPESVQPYHAALGIPQEQATKAVERLIGVVRRATGDSIRALLAECQSAGQPPRAAGLVVGSDIDPARIGNEHIRAHALEGRLFRTAVEQALRLHRIDSIILVERSAYATAAKRLRCPETQIMKRVSELGRTTSGPWRADEKMATLGAWMALV
jgi:hypothetical protein